MAAIAVRDLLQYKKDTETLGITEYIDRRKNDRYKIMSVITFNYTNHDIYGIYLLPEDKSDIYYATHGKGSLAAHDE
jgi:hypothetical protein